MTNRILPLEQRRFFSFTTAILLIFPLILLGGVILLFLKTGGGLKLTAPAPLEALTVERTVLKPGNIEIKVRNSGPEDLTIAQVIVNDAIWPSSVYPSPTIPRLGEATVRIKYMWVEGEAYAVRFFTGNSIPFDVEIPVAFTTPEPDRETFWNFTLIGLYVGIVPVYLGFFWFPALRKLSGRWMDFLLALTAGLLVFLGLDTLAEALEQVKGVPGPFQGIGLIGIGAVGAFMLLEMVSQRQVTMGRSETAQRLGLAFLIAAGIGLHNLGEGLAIGASYNVGEIAFGNFLVIGFIIQNITEGLGIIAPVLRDRPTLGNLALLGLLGGGPAIIGAWAGGFAPSPTLAVFFLAIGAGAIIQVTYQIAKLIRKHAVSEPMPLFVFSGVMAGMSLLWVTGLLIK
jgi:zinc transporter ZupT